MWLSWVAKQKDGWLSRETGGKVERYVAMLVAKQKDGWLSIETGG